MIKWHKKWIEEGLETEIDLDLLKVTLKKESNWKIPGYGLKDSHLSTTD